MSDHGYKEGREVDDYAKYMVKYPDSLTVEIIDHLHKINPGILGREKPCFDLLLDAGCGSGQATKMFAPFFRSVTAFDISKPQIEKAKRLNPLDNVKYVVGRGEAMPAEDNSADLILIAWAAMYMETKMLCNECIRVLKPNGCTALFGFDYIDLRHHSNGDGNDGISDVTGIDLFQAPFEVLHDYFVKTGDVDVEDFTRFEGIYQNIEGLDKERNDKLVYDVTLTLNELQRYFLCIPPFYDFVQQRERNNEPDLLDQLAEKLKKRWNVSHLSDENVHCKLTLNIFLIYLTKKKGQSKHIS